MHCREGRRPAYAVAASAPRLEKSFGFRSPAPDFRDMIRMLQVFRKVESWDDSGARAALSNARAPHWAKINNLPSRIPFPDLGMFNHVIEDDTDDGAEAGADDDSEWIAAAHQRRRGEERPQNMNQSCNGHGCRLGIYCADFLNKYCIWN